MYDNSKNYRSINRKYPKAKPKVLQIEEHLGAMKPEGDVRRCERYFYFGNYLTVEGLINNIDYKPYIQEIRGIASFLEHIKNCHSTNTMNRKNV